jgi:3-phosphoshikimate 1-carboxyvinyltransferase
VTDALLIAPLDAPPDATVRVPGSKSITNRALVCAALAEGRSTLRGALLADDTEAMLEGLRALGVDVSWSATGASNTVTIEVAGCGGRLPVAEALVRARLSGTTARFITPFAAAAGTGAYVVDGAPPLRARPMGPMIDALRTVGSTVQELGEPGRLPISVTGRAPGGSIAVPGHISSQFLSGLLLAGPAFAEGIEISIATQLVSAPYVDLTRSVMSSFGVDIVERPRRDYAVPPSRYRAAEYRVEPDASAASYFFAAAAITGGRVRVDGLGGAALQGDARFVDVLEQMGAEVIRADDSTEVRGTGALRGVSVDLRDLSDTAQTLAAVAVFADSPTTVTGIGFIRRKETDRIGAVVRELQRLGIEATEDDDGFTIAPGTPHAGRVDTYDDHRMAMSFALLGLRVPGIEIADPSCVDKTYPAYFADLDQLRR